MLTYSSLSQWRTDIVLTFRRQPRLARFLLTLTLLVPVILTACAPGDAPPAAVCDFYNRVLFTLRVAGGAAVLVGLLFLGFRKNLSAIIPSLGAQLGAVTVSIAVGLLLLAFAREIGDQILLALNLENLAVLCGL